ncbi:helix-turn-helix domain-containing protein [Paenibacillus sp. JDR-2]|uniref:helix-turn-helix domain-containing protein n=1 Tax=Paenibacillus sp. (strain JDR-2) TaxID=324057 RepID=UPI000166A6F5|nr:helix-turn-helix domain protein [Paenibacillus sp. JDR-2]
MKALERGECRLREHRMRAGLSQEDLSYELVRKFGLEISANMISHYENNRKPMSIYVLRACAVILHKKMDDFYTWST